MATGSMNTGSGDARSAANDSPAGDALQGVPTDVDSRLDPPDSSDLIRLLASTESIDAFLHDLVVHAGQVTAHSCSITARTSKGPQYYTVASTDHRTRQLDEQQYADQGGPCLEALRTALPVIVPDMRAETRWAPYPKQAAELGAASSMSFPLMIQGNSIGALNLYAFQPMAPDAGLRARAEQLAANAAGALAIAMRLAEYTQEAANLRIALTSRSTIDNAIGILMGQQQCTAEEAFDLLRRASQHRNVKLRELAAQIVAGVDRSKPAGHAEGL
jgi:GAF domain-containing protein